MRTDAAIHGLTTAASLWATAAVGVLLGAGEYFIGVAACALLFVLELEKLPGMAGIDADSVRQRRAEARRSPLGASGSCRERTGSVNGIPFALRSGLSSRKTR